jgi:hypothetical protein
MWTLERTIYVLSHGEVWLYPSQVRIATELVDFIIRTWRQIRELIDSPSAMELLRAFQILLALTTVYSCPDGHDGHAHTPRGLSHPEYVSPPTRPLEWGDINILHTTDSHGWLLGHQKISPPEPNYRCVVVRSRNTISCLVSFSGDFGDFVSFVSHMKDIAKVTILM